MRLTIGLPLIVAFSLTACADEKTPDQPKTAAEVKQEVAKLNGPKPGQYRSSVKVVEFDIPGLPPQAADQMKQMMAGKASQPHEYCLTPEQAKGGYEEMLKKGQQGNCTFDRFEARASTIDAAMTCKMEQGMVSSITMKGQTREDGMTMDMDMVQNDANIPGGKMHMTMQMVSQRLGDCPPSQ